ncbi:hypothetical protein J4573_32200 [Actinomadura barringtoniae]|uniref:Uncharacterized protein n=1 Tax=Actinomadura barringtoniae TaxID=1427535 RepID=A0A939PKK1_9ACTN|nr:hypothetical protein [Actinomadura barringtoniae]MBO2451788.1 hypothetical protein [Actinomadura barringtoniae]
MRIAKFPAALLVGASVGGAVLTAGGAAFASQTTPQTPQTPRPAATDTVVAASTHAAKKTDHWNASGKGWRTKGSINYKLATGWVKDTKKDGKCAAVGIAWWKNGVVKDTDIIKACGVGKVKKFRARPGDHGHYWTSTGYNVKAKAL